MFELETTLKKIAKNSKNQSRTEMKRTEKIKKALRILYDNILRLEIFLKKIESSKGKEKRILIQKRIFRDFNFAFRNIHKFENISNDTLLKNQIKRFFRKKLGKLIFKSKLFKRGYKKPKGYPGDFMIIEAMYNNVPLSKGLGYYLDLYFLQNNYVEAVRQRKDWIKSKLLNFLLKKDEELNILNLACGSCREFREIIPVFPKKKKFEWIVNLVDQDQSTIDFVKENLIGFPDKISFRFFKNDVLNFVKSNNEQNTNKYNLIYSIGLADYLPDSYLKLLIKYSFKILQPKGTLIIAHKNVTRFSAPVADWMCDWKFIPRSIQDFKFLIRESLCKFNFTEKYEFSENKLMFYVTIKNKD